MGHLSAIHSQVDEKKLCVGSWQKREKENKAHVEC